jgi:hypothetical protein
VLSGFFNDDPSPKDLSNRKHRVCSALRIMETELNAVEKAYKKLNSVTRLTISVDEWLMLLACGLALIIPDLTGIPSKYGYADYSLRCLFNCSAHQAKSGLEKGPSGQCFRLLHAVCASCFNFEALAFPDHGC